MRPRQRFVYHLEANWGDAFWLGVVFGGGASVVRVWAGGAAGGGRRRGRLRRQYPDLPSHSPRHGGVRRHWAELLGGLAGPRGDVLPGQGAEAGDAGVLHALAGRGGLLEGSGEADGSPAGGGGWAAGVDARAGAGPDEMVAGVVVTRPMVEVGVAYLAKSPLRSRCFRHTSLLRRIADRRRGAATKRESGYVPPKECVRHDFVCSTRR